MQQNNLQIQTNGFIGEKEESENKNYTIFELGEKKYAIETKNVLEINKIMEFDYPNKMPSYVLGLIQFDQSPIGVIDLREVFKTDRVVYDLNAKIIIVQIDKTKENIAFICDRVLDITKLPSAKIHSIPYQENGSIYNGLFIDKGENIYILNVENILKYIDENLAKYEYQKSPDNYFVNDEKSLNVLRERRKFTKKVKQDVQAPKPLYDMGVSFMINDVKYYINMASVKEFYKVNNSKFIKLPSVPEYIYGLINIKGEYITVLDIRSFFNNSNTMIKEKSTIIIINSKEYKLGILADEICESMNIDFEEIIQNKLQKQEENVNLEFVKDGEIYQILDIDQLLKDERLTIC